MYDGKKVLMMLSASIFEIPLIMAAKELGYYVITTGNNKKAPGHKYSDAYIPFDYSDYEGMVRIAKENGVSAISHGCSDNCALTAAYVGERLGLKGHDNYQTAQIIHRKDKFKEFVRNNKICSPYAYYFTNKGEALANIENNTYPVIVKPSDQAGGKGVMRVNCAEDYAEAIEYAFGKSREGKVIVEPFLEGTLHSLCTFIVNQKVVAYSSWNDYSYKNKFMTNSGLCPADGWEDSIKTLIPETEKIARELALVDGLLHMQYIVSGGKAWIIEMMRRTPGNNSTTAAMNSTGIDWRKWIIKAEAGEDCSDIPMQKDCDKLFGYHGIMPEKNGIFKGITIDDRIKNRILELEQYEAIGAVVDDYLYQKMGVAQFYFENEDEKNILIPQINELIKCDIE